MCNPGVLLRFGGLLAAALAATSCASPGSDTKAATPNISIAWDAAEALRHVFTEGCLRAVELDQPIKQTLDRGVPISRVRTLDSSPLKGDPPGTPAYAVQSAASVVMTGTGQRCSVASSSGDGAQLRSVLIEALQTHSREWTTLSGPATPDPTVTIDLYCKRVTGGVMVAQIVTAPGKPTPLIALVFRSQESGCRVKA